ncbi:hypothetical protein ACQJBY_004741 [Aegilops geniculata]
MVLIFISGTAKCMERIWILGRAGSWGPISRPWGPLRGQKNTPEISKHYEKYAIRSLFFPDKEVRLHIEDVAHDLFYRSMGYFMNMTRKLHASNEWSLKEQDLVTSSDEEVNLAYKLAEIQLSLIYDYLYTKFGSLDGILHRLTVLVLNSTALALFVVHHKGGKGRSAAVNYYSVVDVAISYILLVSAVALEMSSILMWLMTSYWPDKVCPGGGHSPRIVLSILKRLRPALESNRLEWSGKLQQYNLIDEIIQDEKARKEYGWLKWMMWHTGIKQYHHTTKHVAISPQVKKVFLDKLCDYHRRLDFTSFRAEWATHFPSSSGFHAAQQAVSNIFQHMDLVSSAFFWHLVTDICLDSDETPSTFRTCSQHMSNYIMHLVYQCNLMLDADGRLLFEDYVKFMTTFCKADNYDKSHLLKRLSSDAGSLSGRTHHLATHVTNLYLLSEIVAAGRWEIIATVWMKMLCYIAIKCDHGFHPCQAAERWRGVPHPCQDAHVSYTPTG